MVCGVRFRMTEILIVCMILLYPSRAAKANKIAAFDAFCRRGAKNRARQGGSCLPSGGGAVDQNAGTPAWKIWLIVLDVVVFAACAAGIAVPVVLYLRGRKQGRQP